MAWKCLTSRTAAPRRKPLSARGSFWRMTVWRERAMKFAVTSGVGVTRVIDRTESARTALERVLALLARKRNDVRIFDQDGSRLTPAELCLLAAQEIAALPDESELSL
jgi:hypothetical protein